MGGGGDEELGAGQSSAAAAPACTWLTRLLVVPVEASAAVAPARHARVRLPWQLGRDWPSGADCCSASRSSCCPGEEAGPPVPWHCGVERQGGHDLIAF
ncbi:hypothetical protein ZWY2020_029301 [Hordeum vulgare]|nr:hypothetical protein ZWY2020_029301 [Hordeum vulgare]